jgi:hypothetical protein
VGVYAATEVALDGQHRAAWVSTEGVYLTNGFTAQRITRDLDWDSTVDVASLGTAVLHWDKKRSALVLAYDSDGGGTNDRWLLLHMEELKDGLPRISGPHYGAINCLTSGKVSGVRRLYSGHVSDGNVYLEDNGRTDASQAYSGTQVPTIVTWHQDWGANMVEVDTLRIGHADLGTGETATLAMTFERDSDGDTQQQAETKTVTMNGRRGTDVFVGRSGERAEWTLTYTGSGSGHIREIVAQVQGGSSEGTTLE